MENDKTRRIHIFDTTLRDGEQSPGASLNSDEKLDIAQKLALLGVDVIEAGFPISSQGDFEAVQRIARTVRGPAIAALSRALCKDIDRAWEAIQYAETPCIHTFISTSPIHMEHKLRKKPDEVLQMAKCSIMYAKDIMAGRGYVEFSAEDATRTEKQFLYEVIDAAIRAGAYVINIPDTVGYSQPMEFAQLISDIRRNVPDIAKARLSVHCHNDLGSASANTAAAIQAGAQQVECTINGIGERAGNAALEEIIATLRTRNDIYRADCQVNSKLIYPISRLVSRLMGIQVQPNKAIVGKNAFAHSSGIHQDGVTKKIETYEIMRPQDYGWIGENIVLSARSGRSGVAKKLTELGYELTDKEIDHTYDLVIALADKKKEVFDADLIAIVEDQVRRTPQIYSLRYLQTISGTITPTATVILDHEGKEYRDAAIGDGPIDAAVSAIDRITGIRGISVDDYSVRSVSKGRDSLGEITIKIKHEGCSYTGRGLDTDVPKASALAYLNAVNKIADKEKNR